MIVTDNKKIANKLNLVLWDRKDSSLRDIEVAIASRKFARHLLEVVPPNLKFIQLTSAGYEGVDISLAKDRNIAVSNAANVYNVGMAEFVVYGMLMCAKRYHHSMKNHFFRPFRNYHFITELSGKTVGILGAGNIGKQVAKRLEAFDMQVLGFDLRSDNRPYFKEIYTLDSLNVFLRQCDYIVNCIPLFPSTEGLLCKEWFDLMKPNVTIINVARKKTINDDDLLHFLKVNRDASAVLDMYETFPNPITNPYRRLPNVLVLPGVTAISQEIEEKLALLCHNNIENYKNGKLLLNLLNA